MSESKKPDSDQPSQSESPPPVAPPDEARQHQIELVNAEPPALLREQRMRTGRVITASWSGPLPPPQVLKQYGEAMPGLDERLVAMTEREQRQRHRRERGELRLLRDQLGLSRRGQTISGWLSALVIIGAILLGMNGHPTAAVALASMPIVALTVAFMTGKIVDRPQRDKRPIERDEDDE